jgi:raffinose/stachyose/melibiose transport system permease protein
MTTKAGSTRLHAVGEKGPSTRAAGRIAVEAVGILLFLLFMMPFGMVVLNAAKTAKEIIFSAVSWPEHWGQMWTNVVTIFNNPTTDYVGAFFDSVIITVLSLAVILLFSAMCAWVLVRNKKRVVHHRVHGLCGGHGHPYKVVMFPLVELAGFWAAPRAYRFWHLPGHRVCVTGVWLLHSIFILHASSRACRWN